MKGEKGALAFFAIAFLVAMIIPSVMWSGYVLSIMWGWFIVPTFGLPSLQVGVAIDISGIISFIVPTSDYKKKEEDEGIGEIVLGGVIRAVGKPAIFLLFGWIVKSWM